MADNVRAERKYRTIEAPPGNWCPQSGLNRRPTAYKAVALPLSYAGERNLATKKPRCRARLLKAWCRKEESNLRPSHYECAALPTELFRQLACHKSKPDMVTARQVFFHYLAVRQTFITFASSLLGDIFRVTRRIIGSIVAFDRFIGTRANLGNRNHRGLY